MELTAKQIKKQQFIHASKYLLDKYPDFVFYSVHWALCRLLFLFNAISIVERSEKDFNDYFLYLIKQN